MTILAFDPDNWLVSLTRSLKSYVEAQIDPTVADADVEMAWPVTDDWTKETPLAKSLIHFEIDDDDNPVWAFGNPGKEVFTESPDGGVTPAYWRIDEAQRHRVNFDVGVWVSAEGGGATARMVLHQMLVNIFSPAGAKQALQDATGGLWVVSFNGGRYTTDRINDLPIWRAHDMTLIVEVFSRHSQVNEVVPDSPIVQDEELTIADNSGNQIPV